MRETELYQPIKAYLEGQGYEVKGEVGAADLVACRGDEEPVIVELETAAGRRDRRPGAAHHGSDP